MARTGHRPAGERLAQKGEGIRRDGPCSGAAANRQDSRGGSPRHGQSGRGRMRTRSPRHGRADEGPARQDWPLRTGSRGPVSSAGATCRTAEQRHGQKDGAGTTATRRSRSPARRSGGHLRSRSPAAGGRGAASGSRARHGDRLARRREDGNDSRAGGAGDSGAAPARQRSPGAPRAEPFRDRRGDERAKQGRQRDGQGEYGMRTGGDGDRGGRGAGGRLRLRSGSPMPPWRTGRGTPWAAPAGGPHGQNRGRAGHRRRCRPVEPSQGSGTGIGARGTEQRVAARGETEPRGPASARPSPGHRRNEEERSRGRSQGLERAPSRGKRNHGLSSDDDR